MLKKRQGWRNEDLFETGPFDLAQPKRLQTVGSTPRKDTLRGPQTGNLILPHKTGTCFALTYGGARYKQRKGSLAKGFPLRGRTIGTLMIFHARC